MKLDGKTYTLKGSLIGRLYVNEAQTTTEKTIAKLLNEGALNITVHYPSHFVVYTQYRGELK